jgi:peptide deformylase
MEILKFPNKRLFQKCEEAAVFGPELLTLLEGMWSVMIAKGGIGLAANQVNLPYRMFVMYGPTDPSKPGSDAEKLFIVNPKIVKKSQFSIALREGCLSSPGEFVVVPDRASWVQIDFQNEKGEIQRRVFKEIHAVCVLHEMEHLDGKSHLQSKSISKKIRKELTKKWGLK